MSGMSFFFAVTMRVSPGLLFIGGLADWQNRVSMPSFAHESNIHPTVRGSAYRQRLHVTFHSGGRDCYRSGPCGSRPTSHWSQARSCRSLARSRLDAFGDGAFPPEG